MGRTCTCSSVETSRTGRLRQQKNLVSRPDDAILR